jgi:GntR family transcriptional regulator
VLSVAGAHRKADKSGELDHLYLDCASEDSVLEEEQVAFLNPGKPFKYSFSRHRYNKFIFKIVNIRK